MFEKVSRSLKYDSNIFFVHRHIYIYMDTTVDHFTPLALRVRGTKKYRINIYMSVCMSVVCQITWNHVNQTRACSKSVLGGKIRPVTPVLFVSTIH